MASKVTDVYSAKNLQYIERLIYDVLAYTLSMSGLPKTSLSTSCYKANDYKFPNFVESAGAAVLTRSLYLRTVGTKLLWSYLLSKRRNSVLNYEDIVESFKYTLLGFRKQGWPETKTFAVEMYLAFCNEFMLFVHHEKRDIDFNKLIKSVSKLIVAEIGPNQDVSEITEEIFSEFDNVSSYTKWVTDFIAKFAIPYGSRDDVPDLFKKCFDKLWTIQLEETSSQETELKRKVKARQGILMNDSISVNTVEESVIFPENLVSETILRVDRKSSKPPKFP